MNAYDVIRRPLFTEKGADLKEANNQVIVEVAAGANKIQIKAAVEEVFKVKVTKVATMRVRGKTKRLGRHEGTTRSWKKAVVTLASGEKLDFLEGVSV